MASVSNNQSKPQQGKATANVERKVSSAQETSSGIKYTLFASGLNYGGRNIELKDKNYTDDLAIIFDVVEEHSYTRTVDKTSYAVEDRVKFSDHGVIEDGKFSFSARVSSSPLSIIQFNYIDKDTDNQNPAASKRPEKALEVLERLIDQRQIVTLVTEDRILDNYILTSMEASRSNSDGAALVFQLEFTEFRTFTLGKTVLATIYTDPKKSGKTKQKALSSHLLHNKKLISWCIKVFLMVLGQKMRMHKWLKICIGMVRQYYAKQVHTILQQANGRIWMVIL